jgi:indole-3-glycerol phosphate synthase
MRAMSGHLRQGSGGQADVLRAIVASARRSADARERQGAAVMEERASAATRRPGAFRDALASPGLRVIAECKRRSPSRGLLRTAYDAAAIAQGYEGAGAAAISVLTEPAFFDGALAHLEQVRARVRLPILRKDFVVTRFQVVEAAAAGADAVLLIVAALTDAELQARLADAAALDLDVLVEVHDREELDRAVAAGAGIVGVNSRDLRTLEVRTGLFDELGPWIPPGVLAVAESGLRTADDLVRLQRGRFDAFLIGERFMTEPDPGAALEQIMLAAASRLTEGTRA